MERFDKKGEPVMRTVCWRTAFRWTPSLPAVTLALLSSLLSGCGLLAASREANHFRDEQSESVRVGLRGCRSGEAAYANYDHRRDVGKGPDCYLAMVDSSARLLPGQSQAPEKHADRVATAMRVVPGPKPLSPWSLSQVKTAGELVDQVAWMAMLANLSYHRFVEAGSRSNSKAACMKGLDEYDPLNTLIGTTSESATAGGWQRWEQDGLGCRAVGGLFYETFVFRAKPDANSRDSRGDIAMAVIAFRGTENYLGQLQRDWPTNLANAFNIMPSDYAEVY